MYENEMNALKKTDVIGLSFTSTGIAAAKWHKGGDGQSRSGVIDEGSAFMGVER